LQAKRFMATAATGIGDVTKFGQGQKTVIAELCRSQASSPPAGNSWRRQWTTYVVREDLYCGGCARTTPSRST
jgi:hypothetical protein